MALVGFASGVLALVALQTLVGYEDAPDRYGGLVGAAVSGVQRVFDPAVPLIGADRRGNSPSNARQALSDAGRLAGQLHEGAAEIGRRERDLLDQAGEAAGGYLDTVRDTVRRLIPGGG